MARIRAKIIVGLWNWVTQQGRKIERLARAHHDPCCNTHTEICTRNERMSEQARNLENNMRSIAEQLHKSSDCIENGGRVQPPARSHSRTHSIDFTIFFCFSFCEMQKRFAFALKWRIQNWISMSFEFRFGRSGHSECNFCMGIPNDGALALTCHTRHNFTYYSTNNICCSVNGELDQRQIWLITLTFSPSATWLLQHAALSYSIVFIVTVLHIYISLCGWCSWCWRQCCHFYSTV